MNIGILGGTFDPVHFGHLAIAEEARQRLSLVQVIFIPAGQPWLKADREITPAVHRIKMIELAISSKPYFELSTIEIEQRGPSYTVDTLSTLQKKLGVEAKLFLLLGWDSLIELPKWHKPAELVKMCQVIVFARASSNLPDLKALEVFIPRLKESTILLDMKPVNISSTDLRMRTAIGLSLNGLVPDQVERYIREQGLYRRAY
jgi:nicotinate-nucleotide adenylyltransferase